jgi:Icc-related predicted phosphoesterase
MKILATADLHGSQYRLNILLKNIDAYNPDLVILCGDITQFGPSEVALNFLNQIPIETLALPGNIDPPDVKKAIHQSRATNIHKTIVTIDGINFVGISGVDNSETQHFFNDASIDANSVLVTHVPPYGLQDKVFLGMHTGSKEIRKIIDHFTPRLVLCGHIHENPGTTKTGDTIVVNCSMGKRGEGAIIEIDATIQVKML